MTLGRLIEILEGVNSNTPVTIGFNEPDSYFGACDCLAFEPCRNTTVGDMLLCAENALGTTYKWRKGGEHRMTAKTPVYIARYGCLGEEIGEILMWIMLDLNYPTECPDCGSLSHTNGKCLL